MKEKCVKPELLAPAGNISCALAAFDAGADAVYAGLDRFNAREKSANFSTDDMGKLISYARKIGKKVYLTLNTLIKEVELKEIVELISEIVYLRPDAVIVQDLGVLHILRKYFPELTIHASTQMGIHNSAGIDVAAGLGVERVILERQVTLDELGLIMENTSTEVEVFVHGALCCSLSGVCTFSSWLGGWSGNRGKCKQPCRRRYFSEDGNGFFFSPQDLYTLDMIPSFKKMGVSSLKIEGRLKKPDYITHVVKAYRMVIDCDDESQIAEVMKRARAELSMAQGRKWSSGFYTEDSLKNLINYTQIGVSGSLCGDVVDTQERNFSVKVSRRLHVGDRVRVQSRAGDEGPALTITKMFVNNKGVNKAVKGETCVVLYDRGDIPFKGQVYKIGVSTDSMESRINNLPEFKPTVDLNISVSSDLLKIEVRGHGSIWETPVEFAKAEKRACDEQQFVEGFKQLGSSSFLLGQCSVDFSGEFFIPSSVLKQLRKQFWSWLEDEITADEIRFGHSGMMSFYNDFKDFEFGEDEEINPYFADCDRGDDVYYAKPESHLPSNRKYILARSIYSYDKKTTEVVLPAFCSEDRVEKLRAHVKRAYEGGVKRFRVTSLFQFDLLKDYDDVQIHVSHPLPVTNSCSATILQELGATKVQPWIELDKESIERIIVASPVKIELYRYGRVPLLVTRAKVSCEGRIKDSRGNEFVVVRDKFTKMNYIYGKQAIMIPKLNNCDSFYDLTNASWGDRDNSTFNFDKEFV